MKYVSTATLFVITVGVAVAACSSATEPMTDGRIPIVQLAVDSLTLTVGDSARLTLMPALPPGIIPENVRWSSSAPAVAAVRRLSSSAAMATAVGTGRAVIYAEADAARDSVFVNVQ